MNATQHYKQRDDRIAFRKIELMIPRELQSPNVWLNKHWTAKYRISQEWEQEIWLAMPSVWRVREKELCVWKRRVTLTRYAPSLKRFIRDDDNLRFTAKPVLDALKRIGLIRDDSRKWLELPLPAQEVSENGQWATRIGIEDC